MSFKLFDIFEALLTKHLTFDVKLGKSDSYDNPRVEGWRGKDFEIVTLKPLVPRRPYCRHLCVGNSCDENANHGKFVKDWILNCDV